jgi:hypothetical protein
MRPGTGSHVLPVLFWSYFEGNPLKYFMSSESVDSRTELLLSRESL